MKLEKLRLAKSILSGRIYAGYLDRSGRRWEKKVDITSDFIKAVLDLWLTGSESGIDIGLESYNEFKYDGKHYRIKIEKVMK